MQNSTATIFDIYRGTTHDGPGLRDTVFFSNCPLSCKWCHNPEGLITKNQVWHQPKTCIGCMSCIEICKNNAISQSETNLIFDAKSCSVCGDCVVECPTKSISYINQKISLDDLIKMLLRDKEYYETSSGGVTASGGEALMQGQFVASMFKELHKHNIHTALDTCAFAPSNVFLSVLKESDCLLLDLKFIDSDLHKLFTNQTNTLILKNAILAKEYAQNHKLEFWIRTPLIPKATATIQNIKEIGEFITNDLSNIVDRWELCSFNNICSSKYERLNIPWEYSNFPLLKKDQAQILLDVAKSTNAANGEIYLTGLLSEN